MNNGVFEVAFALVFLGAFLVGSIPFGLLISTYVFGVDLRQHGSGNIGAANAMRTVGRGGAIGTLVLDAFKGFVPTLLALHYFGLSAALVAGIAAALGHCFTPWLHWHGGKGVATLLGTLLALSPLVALGSVLVYVACLLALRVSAIGSLAAGAASMIGLAMAEGVAGAMYGAFGFLLLIYTHRANIERLRNGSEHIFGRR
jgi:glycerol-3-phosphate acyltransferase PlsY